MLDRNCSEIEDWQTWSSVVDDVADMLLSTVVECIEKQLKLLRRLATEH